MKINYIVIFLCFFSIKNAFTQDSTRLFYTAKFESTFFVDVGSDFVQTNKSGGLHFNLSVNWLAKEKYVVGAAYSQLASIERFAYHGTFTPGEISYGNIKHQSLGLRLGYIFFPHQKIVSLSPDVIAGWGNSTLRIKGTNFKEVLNFGKIQPNINAIFNISSYFRIGVDVHYRVHLGKKFTSQDTPVFSFSPSDLNGVGGGVFFRFGKF